MQESEEIMAKTSKFENTLMDIADFVDSNVYLRSIKDAFTDYVPFIIAGSFGSFCLFDLTSLQDPSDVLLYRFANLI